MKLLQKLIEIQSLSGSEDTIQSFIFDFLKTNNYNPFYVKKNIVFKIKGNNSKKALIFNAHVDTVAIGSKHAWLYNPLKAVVKKDKIYGLGASDEKASIATLLLLAKNLSGKEMPYDIWFTFVVKEEVDGSGTEEFLSWFKKHEKKNYSYLAAILAEPTGLKELEIGHKGNIFVKITTDGDSGHGSMPNLIKKNAIFEMYNVVKKVKTVEKNWIKKYSDTFLGKPSIAITSIQAGTFSSPNKFPDTCELILDIRTTPQLHTKVCSLLKRFFKNVHIGYLYSPVSYGYTDINEKIVKITKGVSGAKILVSAWSNDMSFFTLAKIPAVVIGPGERKVIHKANEYACISKVKKCVKLYQNIINEFA